MYLNPSLHIPTISVLGIFQEKIDGNEFFVFARKYYSHGSLIVPYSAVIMSILIKLRHRQSRRSRKRVRLRNRETKEQEKETLSEA